MVSSDDSLVIIEGQFGHKLSTTYYMHFKKWYACKYVLEIHKKKDLYVIIYEL